MRLYFVGMVSNDTQAEQEDTEENDAHSKNGDTWLVSLQINGAIVALRIDTGMQANLNSTIEINAMKEKPKIIKKRVPLEDYNGKDIENKGQCRLKVTVKKKTHNVLFTVVPEGSESLLGAATSKTLNLVRRVHHINCSEATSTRTVDSIVQRYKDVQRIGMPVIQV